MAFDVNNLTNISQTTKRNSSPVIYSYWNEDDDTVTATGFFDVDTLAVGDQIQVIGDDYTTLAFYRVSAIASGAATVVLLASLSPDATS